jgi:hypothetical protein
MDSVIKTAKKILKKDEKGSIKMKQLVKTVIEKLDSKSDETSTDQVKEWILSSDKFTVDEKLVSLNSSKKRKNDEGDDDEKAKKKAAKRAKKEAKKNKKNKEDSPAPVTTDTMTVENAVTWRKENKVVLRTTQNNDSEGDNGKSASEELNKNEVYLPYGSFSSPKCQESINSVLLKQCTEVNGFTKPSAIQAQCWPVLLHSDNGKTRDVVG